MVFRIYLSLWLVWAVIVSTVYLAGYFFSPLTILLGFVGVGLGFMGMISLLPTMHEHSEDL